MVVFPEKHSFHIYKASILEMIPKSAETNIVEVQSTIPTKTIPEEMIIPEVVIDDFDTWNTEKQSHINDQITSQEKSKEILRQHLLNKYK